MDKGSYIQQLEFMIYEFRLIVNGRWWRLFSCLFSESFSVVAFYRLDRFFYLLFGNYWRILRVFLTPFLFIARPWFGRCEIHYLADIGRGLKILHPSLGVVISGYAIIGENCTLVGGNCIGGRGSMSEGCLVIGNNVIIGVNAVILAPVCVADNVRIGAGAVVVRNAEEGDTLIGVPAYPIK